MKECVELLKEFKDYDIMKAHIEATTEVPEGVRFYDPIYAEVWG